MAQAAVMQLAILFVRARALGTIPAALRSPRIGAALLLAAALLLPFAQLASLLETVSRAARSARTASAAPCVATPDSAADNGAADTPVDSPGGGPIFGPESRFVGPPLDPLGPVVGADPSAPQPRLIRSEPERGPPFAS